MTVMRRGETWSFVVWVRDREGVRRQVWRGGYGLKRDAVSAERRFLVETEDRADDPGCASGPTVREFLEDWLVQSAPTRPVAHRGGRQSASELPLGAGDVLYPRRRWRHQRGPGNRCAGGSTSGSVERGDVVKFCPLDQSVSGAR
jgi:hypothetical protein